MPNNEESLLSVSLSSSEQADEPNIMKEVEEESREGTTRGLRHCDCKSSKLVLPVMLMPHSISRIVVREQQG